MKFVLPLAILATFTGTLAGHNPITPDEDTRRELIDETTKAYTGMIQISHSVIGSHSNSVETLTIFVTNGEARCTGSIRDSQAGTKGIIGRALFHIAFVSWDTLIDDMFPPDIETVTYTDRQIVEYRERLRREHPPGEMAYVWEVACPGTAGLPAAWSNRRTSYNQPGGPRWDAVNNRQIFPETLSGQWSIPAPETDGENGVSGIYSMTWRLCRAATCAPLPPQ